MKIKFRLTSILLSFTTLFALANCKTTNTTTSATDPLDTPAERVFTEKVPMAEDVDYDFEGKNSFGIMYVAVKQTDDGTTTFGKEFVITENVKPYGKKAISKNGISIDFSGILHKFTVTESTDYDLLYAIYDRAIKSDECLFTGGSTIYSFVVKDSTNTTTIAITSYGKGDEYAVYSNGNKTYATPVTLIEMRKLMRIDARLAYTQGVYASTPYGFLVYFTRMHPDRPYTLTLSLGSDKKTFDSETAKSFINSISSADYNDDFDWQVAINDKNYVDLSNAIKIEEVMEYNEKMNDSLVFYLLPSGKLLYRTSACGISVGAPSIDRYMYGYFADFTYVHELTWSYDTALAALQS